LNNLQPLQDFKKKMSQTIEEKKESKPAQEENLTKQQTQQTDDIPLTQLLEGLSGLEEEMKDEPLFVALTESLKIIEGQKLIIMELRSELEKRDNNPNIIQLQKTIQQQEQVILKYVLQKQQPWPADLDLSKVFENEDCNENEDADDEHDESLASKV
jgi:hypothetical protein